MRVFIATFSFKPDSCKNISSVSLTVGQAYKILNSTKRTEPGIWILVIADNGIKYDVYLNNEELALGIIEKVKDKKRR